MNKATLSLIVVGGLIFILLVAGVTAYRIKFKRMEEAWINEKTQRENLERTLTATQQQLSAKINEISILQDALDTLRNRASNLSQLPSETKIRQGKVER